MLEVDMNEDCRELVCGLSKKSIRHKQMFAATFMSAYGYDLSIGLNPHSVGSLHELYHEWLVRR